MKLPDRDLARAAQAIRDQLAMLASIRCGRVQEHIAVLAERLNDLASIRSGLRVCRHRGWNAGTSQLTERARRILVYLHPVLAEIERTLSTATEEAPSVRQLCEELRQVEDEFDELRFNRKAGDLSAITSPIELEGVWLGEFEIRLHIPDLSRVHTAMPVNVIALDPHPAASNRRVTHPHVSDDRLCPGNASAAIHAALAAGRICDFFTIVASVLRHYNRDSPFIPLDEWEGVNACCDCGATMACDRGYICTACGEDFCEECIFECSSCDESFCDRCLNNCSVCGQAVCRSCETSCPDCGERLCQECLEENKCHCRHNDQETEHDQQERRSTTEPSTEGGAGEECTESDAPCQPCQSAAGSARAALHADSLGQAHLLP